jgi:hypothetical protein
LLAELCAKLFGAAAATNPAAAARAKNIFIDFISPLLFCASRVSLSRAEVYSIAAATVHFLKIVLPAFHAENATLGLSVSRITCSARPGAILLISGRMRLVFRPSRHQPAPHCCVTHSIGLAPPAFKHILPAVITKVL